MAHPPRALSYRGRGGRVRRRGAPHGSRGRDGQVDDGRLRGGRSGRRLVEDQAGGDTRPRGAGGRMGWRTAAGLVEQPPPRRTRRGGRRLRHARQDLQGADRRDTCMADPPAARAGDRSRPPRTSGRCSLSRSPSTRCRSAGAIRAGPRCGSRASNATATTRPRPRPTRSRPCVRSAGRSRPLGQRRVPKGISGGIDQRTGKKMSVRHFDESGSAPGSVA